MKNVVSILVFLFAILLLLTFLPKDMMPMVTDCFIKIIGVLPLVILCKHSLKDKKKKKKKK